MSSERTLETAVEFVPVPQGRALTQFKPGQSGNPLGRRKGSKNKISEMLITEMTVAFEQFGAAALRRAATEQPVEFLKLYAALVRKWDLPDHVQKPEGNWGWLDAMPDEYLELLQPFIRQMVEADEAAQARPATTGE